MIPAKFVDIKLLAECPCGHTWDPIGTYTIGAYMSGGCETCSSPSWYIQCPKCLGKNGDLY